MLGAVALASPARDGQKCVVVHAVATVEFWGLDVNAVLHAPGFPVREGLNVNEMIHAPRSRLLSQCGLQQHFGVL